MTLQLERLEARAAETLRGAVRESLPVERTLTLPGRPPGASSPSLNEGEWRPAPRGTVWGGEEPWSWFRVWFRVPAAWAGSRVRLTLPLGGQGMLYLDGVPWQGRDENHVHANLPRSLCDGTLYLLACESYAARATTHVRRPDEYFTLGECRLERIDDETEALAYDLLVGVETLRVLPVAGSDHAPLLALLLKAEQAVDRLDPASDAFLASVRAARAILREGLPALAAASAPGRGRIMAVGHAHIDTAWLWPLAQTRRKVARSWSTVLRLMERYPDYHFLCSQPQQYAWLEEDEPDLYRQVAARIREGRWEPAGAMWVEPDANLTAGESLVRQFLYGQRYLQTHFGLRSGILWLPDAFGYSAALPQLMRSAGVHTFVTTKMSWNTGNRMPHDTFRWRGLDGSEVLAYFITGSRHWRPEDWVEAPDGNPRGQDTYNGDLSLKEVLGSYVRYRDKGINTHTLYAFGWGDGGGGPTEHMLEYADRMGDYPGVPRLAQGNADHFLRALKEQVWDDPLTAIWDGELYFEYHRGTYTSQWRAKWDNRRSELLLREAELWFSWARTLGAAAQSWQVTLTHCWEIILLNQFHDILPGSSIGEVYEDQRRQHAEVREEAEAVLARAQEAVAGRIGASGHALALFHALPWPREGTVSLILPAAVQDDDQLLDADGAPLATQAVVDLDGMHRTLVAGVCIPAHGYTTLLLGNGDPLGGTAELRVEDRLLENRFVRLTLDERGCFASLFDKQHGREVLAPGGGGNRLQAFEDKPINFDAWDIDQFYTEKAREIDDVTSWDIVERGPVRAAIEISRRFDRSTIRQRILLHADSPRVTVQTHVDWHQRQVLLKAAFPLAVHSTEAAYECAFGYVRRPTHQNTSWDAARFEVAAHRWADLSETGYGVSLLNDSKYGHDCQGNVLRLTLLTSAIEPDPMADEGTHTFSYALLPHGPDWTIEDTIRAAHAFNLPVQARLVGTGGDLPAAGSLVSSDHDHAVVDTVKPAEDGDGLIVRVYDCANRRGPVTLQFGRSLSSAEAVTILEEPDREAGTLTLAGDRLHCDLLPFQVRSFRVRLKG
ncbi:MAG TPA: alpha-mannosidase [Chloroflexota bacterium]|nr:alpha-mannosidase [Chloroflexota bacterium]